MLAIYTAMQQVKVIKKAMETQQQNISTIYLSNGGDTCEGTALSDITPIRCSVIYDSTSKLNWSSYTIGNHDLGLGNESMQYLKDLYTNKNITNLISTNIVYYENNSEYFALPYKYEVLSNGLRALSLGAMYGSGYYTDLRVFNIVDQMKKSYMQNVFDQYKNDIDIIIINCHIGHDDEQLQEIHQFLREYFYDVNPTLPIVILSAHTHTVQYNNTLACQNDSNCYSIEAGCYMQEMQHLNLSIDFSEDTNKSYISGSQIYKPATLKTDNYAQRFNITSEQFPTEDSIEIEDYIEYYQELYGTNTQLGRSKFYYTSVSDVELPNCMAKLYFKTAFDAYIADPSDEKQITLCAYGTVRAPLYQGKITIDDVQSVLPFQNQFRLVKNMSCGTLKGFINQGNLDYTRYALFEECEEGKYYNLLTDTYNGPYAYNYAVGTNQSVQMIDYQPRDNRISSTNQLFSLFVQEQMQINSYTQQNYNFMNQQVLVISCAVYSIIMYTIIFIISQIKKDGRISLQQEKTQQYDQLL